MGSGAARPQGVKPKDSNSSSLQKKCRSEVILAPKAEATRGREGERLSWSWSEYGTGPSIMTWSVWCEMWALGLIDHAHRLWGKQIMKNNNVWVSSAWSHLFLQVSAVWTRLWRCIAQLKSKSNHDFTLIGYKCKASLVLLSLSLLSEGILVSSLFLIYLFFCKEPPISRGLRHVFYNFHENPCHSSITDNNLET